MEGKLNSASHVPYTLPTNNLIVSFSAVFLRYLTYYTPKKVIYSTRICITKNRLPFHLIETHRVIILGNNVWFQGGPHVDRKTPWFLPSHSIQHVSTQTKAFVTAICSNFMEGGWNFFYEDWWLNTSNVLLVTANKWDALPRVLYAAQREPAQLDVEWQRWGSSPHLYGRAGNKKNKPFENYSRDLPKAPSFGPQRRLRKTFSPNISCMDFQIFWSQRENSPRNSSKRIRR